MKAKTMSLVAKGISIAMILSSWIANQFFGFSYSMTDTILASATISAVFSDISLNMFADKKYGIKKDQ
jgi:hypothetical protein